MSHTTIEHAYQLLLDEGFIYSKPRSGYYVSDIESLPVVNTESYHDYMGNEINEETYNNDGPQYAFNLAEIDSESFLCTYSENMPKMSSKMINSIYYNVAKFKEFMRYDNKLHITYLTIEA